MSRYANLLSPEVLAILSGLCIVGIILFAHMDRQSQGYDLRAQRLAVRVQELMLTEPPQAPAAPAAAVGQAEPLQAPVAVVAAPPVRLTLDYLRQRGLSLPEGFTVRFNPDRDLPSDWEIDVWHEGGKHLYRVTARGVGEEMR